VLLQASPTRSISLRNPLVYKNGCDADTRSDSRACILMMHRGQHCKLGWLTTIRQHIMPLKVVEHSEVCRQVNQNKPGISLTQATFKSDARAGCPLHQSYLQQQTARLDQRAPTTCLEARDQVNEQGGMQLQRHPQPDLQFMSNTSNWHLRLQPTRKNREGPLPCCALTGGWQLTQRMHLVCVPGQAWRRPPQYRDTILLSRWRQHSRRHRSLITRGLSLSQEAYLAHTLHTTNAEPRGHKHARRLASLSLCLRSLYSLSFFSSRAARAAAAPRPRHPPPCPAHLELPLSPAPDHALSR
jgi:hypothetical protein